MEINVYSICHLGKVREKNQDNYYCNGVMPDTENSNFRYGGSLEASEPLLFGVFDGMGGHLHGERASLFAVQTCDALFSKYRGGNPFGIMNEICTTANKMICDEMENVVKGRMGSTASMVLFEQGGMYVCDLGDSPIFLIHGGDIRQISYEHTERHNYEQIFGDNYDKNKKFRLTQHLGIFPNEMVLSPYNKREPFEVGDRFLICSDGVTDMISKQEIAEIISSKKTVDKAAELLLKTALDNGGRDNITIILGEISGDMSEFEDMDPITVENQVSEPVNERNYAPPAPQNVPQNMPQSMPMSAPQPVPRKNAHTPLLIVAVVLVVIAMGITGFVVLKLLSASDSEDDAAAETTISATTAAPTSGTDSQDEKKYNDLVDKAKDAFDKLGEFADEIAE